MLALHLAGNQLNSACLTFYCLSPVLALHPLSLFRFRVLFALPRAATLFISNNKLAAVYSSLIPHLLSVPILFQDLRHKVAKVMAATSRMSQFVAPPPLYLRTDRICSSHFRASHEMEDRHDGMSHRTKLRNCQQRRRRDKESVDAQLDLTHTLVSEQLRVS